MIGRRGKPRRLPLPRAWAPRPAFRPAPAEHWLTRHERERETQDEVLRKRIEGSGPGSASALFIGTLEGNDFGRRGTG